MYQYTEFDREFVQARANQYRDQLSRWQAGKLPEDEFRPLRLQNGWYVQRYAPMLRVAVPYGELSSAQVRVLAKIAREYDQPNAALFHEAQAKQDKLGPVNLKNGLSVSSKLTTGYAHFTTRQNVQYNWIPLDKSADVMDLLASVNMHGIQTSGNVHPQHHQRRARRHRGRRNRRPAALRRNPAPVEHAAPRVRLPAAQVQDRHQRRPEDRAATAWHDVGLHLIRNAEGELGFKVLVGGGMGRTPVIGTVIREFLPWHQIMNYLEAVVRVYNRYGRRDNIYKARIKILVKAEGQRYIDDVEAEYKQILEHDGAPHTITQEELDRVTASFVPPTLNCDRKSADAKIANILRAAAEDDVEFGRWLQRNVARTRTPTCAP
jgi:sulfite reductase (NADPH) hemoprotein beta-component